MSYMNRLSNAKNEFQGEYKRVLCVCSAGVLRSPTAALVLSQEPYSFNTRAAGLNEEYALILVDDILLTWAQEIVCMDVKQAGQIGRMLEQAGLSRKVTVLNIPDNFEYRDGRLIKMIREKYDALAK